MKRRLLKRAEAPEAEDPARLRSRRPRADRGVRAGATPVAQAAPPPPRVGQAREVRTAQMGLGPEVRTIRRTTPSEDPAQGRDLGAVRGRVLVLLTPLVARALDLDLVPALTAVVRVRVPALTGQVPDPEEIKTVTPAAGLVVTGTRVPRMMAVAQVMTRVPLPRHSTTLQLAPDPVPTTT